MNRGPFVPTHRLRYGSLEASSFFKAIVAKPKDMRARLVFADLLDELGGEAAEFARFIRLQFELAAGTPAASSELTNFIIETCRGELPPPFLVPGGWDPFASFENWGVQDNAVVRDEKLRDVDGLYGTCFEWRNGFLDTVRLPYRAWMNYHWDELDPAGVVGRPCGIFHLSELFRHNPIQRAEPFGLRPLEADEFYDSNGQHVSSPRRKRFAWRFDGNGSVNEGGEYLPSTIVDQMPPPAYRNSYSWHGDYFWFYADEASAMSALASSALKAARAAARVEP